MVRSNWQLVRVRPHKMLSRVYTKIGNGKGNIQVVWLCSDHAIIIRHIFFPPVAPKWQKKGQRTLIETEKHVLPVQPFHSVYKLNTYFSTLDECRKPAWLICPPFPHHQCNVGCYQPVNADWLSCSFCCKLFLRPEQGGNGCNRQTHVTLFYCCFSTLEYILSWSFLSFHPWKSRTT